MKQIKNLQTNISDLSNWYFKPKTFENSGDLYEKLGIKFFKNYCPNAGTKFSLTGKYKVQGKENLRKFINETKHSEKIHLFLGAGLAVLDTLLLYNDNIDVKTFGYLSLANAAINLYPIMAQRYNRNKAEKIMNKINMRENNNE